MVAGNSDSVALTRFAVEAGDDGAAEARAGAARPRSALFSWPGPERPSAIAE